MYNRWKGDELTTVKSTNFMGALAGKAAGVQINSSASGPKWWCKGCNARC